MPHAPGSPRPEGSAGSVKLQRMNHRNEEEEAGKTATRIEARGPGGSDPDVIDLGDGISVIEGLPTFNAGLRQFLSNLFTENLGNAVTKFGRGEFSETLQAAIAGGQITDPGDAVGNETGGSFFGRVARNAKAKQRARESLGQPGASPGVAGGIATAATGLSGLSSLAELLGIGGQDEPIDVNTGGQPFQPQFEDGSVDLQIFLQLLQSLEGEGQALPVGASPFHTGVGASPFNAGDTGQVEGSTLGLPERFASGARTAAGLPTVNTTMAPPGPALPPPTTSMAPAPPPQIGAPAGAFPAPDTSQLPENNAFADIAQQFSLPTFGGDTSVGPTPLQQQSTQFASDFLGTNPFTDTANMQGALSSLIGGERFDNTAQFDALEARSQRRLGEESAQLKELFGSQGARFGSDIARGQAGLSARFLENEALQRAQIGQSSFENAQNRRLQALPLPGQLGQQQLNQATSAFNIGQAGQAGQERDLQRQMAEFARTQGALFPQLLQFGLGGTEGDTTVINPNQLP